MQTLEGRPSGGEWHASLEGAVELIARTAGLRDPHLLLHHERAAEIAAAIAREFGLPDAELRPIRLAAMVHDIGMLHIPSEIVLRPRELSDAEYRFVQAHPIVGRTFLRSVNLPAPIPEIVGQHHERLDGSGYPQGLAGDRILLGARILAVAEVAEAIISWQPYRAARGIAAAVAEIERDKGRLYDPDVVDACVTVLRRGGFAPAPIAPPPGVAPPP